MAIKFTYYSGQIIYAIYIQIFYGVAVVFQD